MICTLYVAAWLLPISITLNMKGYEAAEAAHSILMQGVKYFYNIGAVDSDNSPAHILKNVVKIVAGAPNILFVLSVIFLILGKRQALYFAAPGLLVMVVWGIGVNPIGGYGLWVIAGAGVFVLAANLYKTETNISYRRFLISGPLLISYIVGALILLSEILESST
jgi:hypothetical protein